MIHITKHSGKMLGISSISTSTLTNEFCQQMSKTTGTICGKCYAARLEKIRPGLRKNLQENSETLSKDLTDDEIPDLSKYTHMRINSFGELINTDHFLNVVKIAVKNPATIITVYTKRSDILNKVKYTKPDNLIIIQSSPMLNVQSTCNNANVDKVFTVYTKENTTQEINCAQSCAKCMKCYLPADPTFHISEKIK